MLGKGASCVIFCVNSWASLYVGAHHQFTTGLIGRSVLWILIRPLMVGADRLRLIYFHLASRGIRVLLSLKVFLILDWNVFVGLVELVCKALVRMKSCILESYCWVGRMTMALPLLSLLCSFGV
jgi:hypothetical protein